MQVLQAARHLNCRRQILQAASFQRNISILIYASFISHKFTFFLQKLLQNMIESFFHTYYAEKQKKAEKYCIHSREEVQCHQPDRLWNAWQTGSLILVLMADRIGISAAMAMMLAFGITAIWWVAVTIPLLLNYKQNYYAETKVSVKETVVHLGNIFSELKANKKVLLFLISFFFYIDGVYTIIEISTAYGKDVGIGDSSMLLALLLTQVVAFPCSILFGKLVRRFESEKLILVCIGAYFLIALFALQLDTAWKFWFLATCVGVFQGAIQALSRSFYNIQLNLYKICDTFTEND
jgi:permease, major facilitator family